MGGIAHIPAGWIAFEEFICEGETLDQLRARHDRYRISHPTGFVRFTNLRDFVESGIGQGVTERASSAT